MNDTFYQNKKEIFSDFADFVSKGKADFYKKNLMPLVEALENFDIGNHHLVSTVRAKLGKKLAV